jgi:hypothetical protein
VRLKWSTGIVGVPHPGRHSLMEFHPDIKIDPGVSICFKCAGKFKNPTGEPINTKLNIVIYKRLFPRIREFFGYEGYRFVLEHIECE